jgi:hypothetical protein
MADKADCEAAAEGLRRFAMQMERQGHPKEAVVDALLAVGLSAAHRLGGPGHLAVYLGELAHRYQAEANGALGARTH